MRSRRVGMVAVVALAVALVNVFALLADATVQTTPNKSFQVGDWITQGGDVVGCKCGKTTGPCVCEVLVTDTRP